MNFDCCDVIHDSDQSVILFFDFLIHSGQSLHILSELQKFYRLSKKNFTSSFALKLLNMDILFSSFCAVVALGMTVSLNNNKMFSLSYIFRSS